MRHCGRSICRAGRDDRSEDEGRGKDIDTSNNGDGGWGSSIAGAKELRAVREECQIMADGGDALLTVLGNCRP